MSNTITEKYFTQGDFSQRAKEVLARVTAETGFVVEKEIFRGFIYDSKKVGSLIYHGLLHNKPAVLKLQGLQPEINEADILKGFNAQNHSRIVRVPQLYRHQPWTSELGYGYLITEYIDAPTIFAMPFADEDARRTFCNFYQEYRTHALTAPWMGQETADTLEWTRKRAEHWKNICDVKGRILPEASSALLRRYDTLASKHFSTVPMVFSHGHLTADDIYRMPDGTFVVLSNLFWSYRPQWYDLAFNIWSCLTHIRDTSFTFDQLLAYVDAWIASYRSIPVVQQDDDFNRKINAVLLERTLGTILADLGAGEFYDRPENQAIFRHLLDLHQRLFNHLAEKLQ